MIQFKIGMAYATLAKNTSAIICNRSKSFVTVKTVRPGSPDKIFRKKLWRLFNVITNEFFTERAFFHALAYNRGKLFALATLDVE